MADLLPPGSSSPDPAGTRTTQSLDVPLAPIGGGSRGSRRIGPRVLVLAVGGVVVAGVMLAQLFPAGPERAALVSPRTGAVAPSSSPFDAPAVASARRVKASELVAGIADASLDGSLVYADAKLIGRCRPAATTGCTIDLSVDGLAVDVVQAASIRGEPAPVQPGSLLVMAVRGRGLDYLGSLIVDPHGPPPLDALSARAATAPAPFASQLHDVRGWLIVGLPCVAATGGGCERTPLLADAPPADGSPTLGGGRPVQLAPTVWGVDPAGGTMSAGPFLVRGTGWPPVPWQVVARYDPSRSVRVVIP